MKKPKLIKTFIINDLSERDYLEILKRKIRKYIIAIMLTNYVNCQEQLKHVAKNGIKTKHICDQ